MTGSAGAVGTTVLSAASGLPGGFVTASVSTEAVPDVAAGVASAVDAARFSAVGASVALAGEYSCA